MNRRYISVLLLAIAAVTFWLASAIHFGLAIPLGFATISDPFAGAAIPEAVVGTAVALGTLALRSRPLAGRKIALGTTIFAIVATLYGLSVTVSGGRTADVAYHISVLLILGASLALLWRLPRRQWSA